MRITAVLLQHPESCYHINKTAEEGKVRSIEAEDSGYVIRFYTQGDYPNKSVIVPYHNISCIIYEEE